ncbi:MAG: hypothetical protein RLZZ278_1728, partial [Pseudomonadota bacterium]
KAADQQNPRGKAQGSAANLGKGRKLQHSNDGMDIKA